MAEGGRELETQSDPEMEMNDHSSPLDSMDSMSQSLMETRPAQTQGTRGGVNARRRTSERPGAKEFLQKFEERLNNQRRTWSIRSLEEVPRKVAHIEPWLPVPGRGRGRLMRFLAQTVPHEWNHINWDAILGPVLPGSQ